jgi:hypothetical protein
MPLQLLVGQQTTLTVPPWRPGKQRPVPRVALDVGVDKEDAEANVRIADAAVAVIVVGLPRELLVEDEPALPQEVVPR